MKDGVQRDRERVGENRLLVGHVVGDRNALRLVGGEERREAAGRLAAVAVMDAGGEGALAEVEALGELALAAPLARIEAAR